MLLRRSATWPAAPRKLSFTFRRLSGCRALTRRNRRETTASTTTRRLVEGISRLAWRRVGAFMHLPAVATHASTQQMVPINPADLEAALAKDLEQS